MIMKIRKILLGTFLAAVFLAAASGRDSRNDKQIHDLDAPKAQAEEIRGPAATLSPFQRSKISLKQNGLCYYKTTAGESWYDPEEYGYEVTDTVYELFAFEQEFDENGNAKYTDIVVPREIDGDPVIDCNSFIDHYEIKSLRVKAAYSDWRDYSTRSFAEDFEESRVSGCTNLEYYEMADDTYSLDEWQLLGCNSLKTIVIPKGMKNIYDYAFDRCKRPEKIIFKKFSNLDYVEGVKGLSGWSKQHTKKNGMVIYKQCLLDAGKGGGTLTIRGGQIKKVMAKAFQNNKASTIKLLGVKKLGEQTFDDCNAEKIILGKKINVIPWRCFLGADKLKEIHLLTPKKIIWEPGRYRGYSGLTLSDWNPPNIDIYIHSDKFHTESVQEWNCGKNVTVHVPKKVMAKYRKYTKCKVVAL